MKEKKAMATFLLARKRVEMVEEYQGVIRMSAQFL